MKMITSLPRRRSGTEMVLSREAACCWDGAARRSFDEAPVRLSDEGEPRINDEGDTTKR